MRRIAVLLVIASALISEVSYAVTDPSTRIKGPFKTRPDVTRQCLQCHEQQALHFMKTVHWTWS